jgi:hypothetical protein
MFSRCKSLSLFPDISKWRIKEYLYVSELFRDCSSLTVLPDISKWESKVLDTHAMFNDCISLVKKPIQFISWRESNINCINFDMP